MFRVTPLIWSAPLALKQGESGIIRHEIDGGFLVSAEHDDVFHDPCRFLAGDIGQLEAVPVQVDGMDIVAGIAHMNAVALTLSQVKAGRNRCTAHGIRNVIN